MNEEPNKTLDEIRRRRRGDLARNAFAISSGIVSAILAMILWIVLDRLEEETSAYVQAAQGTVKNACEAVEGQGRPLPAEVQRDCAAAERNELPQVLQSVVDNPDPNDPEFQDPEGQESETQDPENQDPELQDPEIQDPEAPDEETNDPDPDDPEVQDEEVQDEEVQEPEVQEPEQQSAPVCPDGYAQAPFIWYGRDGQPGAAEDPNDQPGEGDDEYWIVCKKVG